MARGRRFIPRQVGGLVGFGCIGDEALYPNLIGTFGKGFAHSQLGEVIVADYLVPVRK